jgi:hypothetical protein
VPEERPALAEGSSSDLRSHPSSPSNARRALAIVASLQSGEPGSEEVFDAFWELDALPVEDVREALAAWVGPLPDMDRLDSATRVAHGLPPRPLRLRALSVARDADILDLGPVAEEQLRLAGKSWDGVDLAPEERLDGELEGSFAGTFERRVLADADAPGDVPLFDMILFGEDTGVVFAAGKTTVVALIAYGKVEMRERHTRVALEDALAASKIARDDALAHDAGNVLPPPQKEEELSSSAETPAAEAAEEPKPAKVAKRASTRAKATKAKSETAKKAAKPAKAAKKSATKAKPAKKPSAKKSAKTSAKTAAKRRATKEG